MRIFSGAKRFGHCIQTRSKKVFGANLQKHLSAYKRPLFCAGDCFRRAFPGCLKGLSVGTQSSIDQCLSSSLVRYRSREIFSKGFGQAFTIEVRLVVKRVIGRE